MSYNYVVKTGTLKAFLERVKSKDLEVPDKVTIAYLESIGYKSTNDRPIIRVLKSIDFIDGNGVPTQKFKDFRTELSGQVMAEALKKTYADLFRTYSNPLEKGKEDLENFFAKAKPSVKKHVLGLYVDTFSTLVGFANFGAAPVMPTPTPSAPTLTSSSTPSGVQLPTTPEGVRLDVSIRIELPITQDADVYDKIFKSLRKNLLAPDSEED